MDHKDGSIFRLGLLPGDAVTGTCSSLLDLVSGNRIARTSYTLSQVPLKMSGSRLMHDSQSVHRIDR